MRATLRQSSLGRPAFLTLAQAAPRDTVHELTARRERLGFGGSVHDLAGRSGGCRAVPSMSAELEADLVWTQPRRGMVCDQREALREVTCMEG